MSNTNIFQDFIGKYVLVRHNLMGVNVGYLKNYDNNNILLSESRKLWRWQAKDSIALESVAKKGITTGTKATHEVKSVIIPLQELCGIIIIDDICIINEIKRFPVAEQN